MASCLYKPRHRCNRHEFAENTRFPQSCAVWILMNIQQAIHYISSSHTEPTAVRDTTYWIQQKSHFFGSISKLDA